jgi:hypothetical protein
VSPFEITHQSFIKCRANIMRKPRLLSIGLFVTVFLFLSLPFLPGQTSGTGGLAGSVKDSTGAVIPDATVTLTSASTGQTRTVNTGQYGSYNFQLLLPGQYTLTVEKSGFKKLVQQSISIIVTQVTAVENVLEVGGANESVTVSAAMETIQTSNSTIGALVDSESIVEMPLSTRNYTNLLGLAAGANAAVNNASELGKGHQLIAVNGSGVFQNNYSMDGASVNNVSTNQTQETGANASFGIPNPDSIQEFKIQTSSYDAGYGRNSGANVNVVTKSGGNEFHGTMFEFFRNTALNANEFFNKYSQLAQGLDNKPQRLDQNQFGGVFGGPIKKDKLFFFISYQETRQKNGASPYGYSTGVILPPIPQGDRSSPAFVTAMGSRFCQPDQRTMFWFMGSELVSCDGSNINPVALKILQLKLADGSYYIPSPTTSGPISYSIPAIYTEHQGMGNWDWNINSKHTLAGRYFFSTDPTVAPFPGGLGFPGPNVPGNPVSWKYSAHNASLKLTSTLSSKVVNEARASYQRYGVHNSNDIPFTASEVGMTPVQPELNKLPNIWFLPIGGSSHFDLGSHPFFGNNAAVNQYEWADQVSWVAGRHTTRFGGELERDQWNWIFNSLAEGAVMIFPTFSDFLIGKPAFQNGSIFSNIINIPNFVTRGPTGGIDKAYRAGYYNLFFQDDIKISDGLTINAGLRWEFITGISEAGGKFSMLWLDEIAKAGTPGTSPATATFAGYVVPKNYNGPDFPDGVIRSTSNSMLGDMPKNNFSPRFGFAWQPLSNSRLVLRGGAGVFYDRFPITTLAQAAEQSIPFAYTLPFNLFGYQGSLASPFDPTLPGWNQPRWLDPVSGTGSNIQATVDSHNMKNSTVYAWNLNTQYEFAKNWVLELGYAGSHGLHTMLAAKYPFNAAPLASPDHPINGITTNTAANAIARAPYMGLSPFSILSDTIGSFKYNSFQSTVRKQFSKGLQFQGAYTYSHAVSTGGGSNEDTLYWNPTDFKMHYGPNRFYRPHRFTASYTYEIPYADGAGFKRKALGGWSLSGVTVIQSGAPLTITDASGATVYFGGTGAVVSANAQYAPGMGPGNVKAEGDLTQRVYEGLKGGTGYINKNAFTAVPNTGSPGDTLWGNSGYGIILGPGQHNWDMSLQKTTQVGGFTESGNLVFRAEFFNMFNHPQFADPNTDYNSGNLGQITNSSVNTRLIQFMLKYQF